MASLQAKIQSQASLLAFLPLAQTGRDDGLRLQHRDYNLGPQAAINQPVGAGPFAGESVLDLPDTEYLRGGQMSAKFDGADQITVFFWLRPNALSGANKYIFVSRFSDNNTAIRAEIESNGNIDVRVRGATGDTFATAAMPAGLVASTPSWITAVIDLAADQVTMRLDTTELAVVGLSNAVTSPFVSPGGIIADTNRDAIGGNTATSGNEIDARVGYMAFFSAAIAKSITDDWVNNSSRGVSLGGIDAVSATLTAAGDVLRDLDNSPLASQTINCVLYPGLDMTEAPMDLFNVTLTASGAIPAGIEVDSTLANGASAIMAYHKVGELPAGSGIGHGIHEVTLPWV